MTTIYPHRVSKSLFHELAGRNGKGGFPFVFEGCLIGLFNDGYLFNIISEEISLNPRAVQIRQKDWEGGHFTDVNAEDDFYLRDQKLIIPTLNVQIILDKAPFWDPTPLYLSRLLPFSKIRQNLDLLMKCHEEEMKLGSSLFHNAQKERVCSLERSFEKGNKQDIKSAIESLLGFGPGLTPSGDDFMVGVIAVMHFVGNIETKLRPLKNMVTEIVFAALKKTTIISQAMLIEAIAGRFPYLISSFMEHFLTNNDEEILLACVHNLEKFGASSGTNILDGATWALRNVCQFEEERSDMVNVSSRHN